jgi:FAD-dependent urate hydroxylase
MLGRTSESAAVQDHTTSAATGLVSLAREVARDLARLNYPAANWTPPTPASDGSTACDVLVIGAGMLGQTAAFALQRDGVRNIRVVDRAQKGREGPWAAYARMEILRSPKHLIGPDLGVPSLTFRAWWEAQHGAAGFAALHKAGRMAWADYLLWVRDQIDLPVENGVEAVLIEPGLPLARVTLQSAQGVEVVETRKVVLAGGRDGAGAPRLPFFPSFDATRGRRGRVFHSSDAIPFCDFAGRHVAVLGGGASAFDNAGTALEAGVRVTMFLRRPYLPQVNKSKWTGFPGFLHGFVGLDDATRWRFYTYIFAEQVPPPYESVLRCDRHPEFSIRFSEPWDDLAEDGDGVTIATRLGRHRVDAAILATGFDVDLLRRRECAAFRDHVLTWRDRVSDGEAQAHSEAARFPFLDEGFGLRERTAGVCPGLRNLHLFNWGVTMSHGALAGDIPGILPGVNRLSQALVRDLFAADADLHFQRLLAHEDEELRPTARFVPKEARR